MGMPVFMESGLQKWQSVCRVARIKIDQPKKGILV